MLVVKKETSLNRQVTSRTVIKDTTKPPVLVFRRLDAKSGLPHFNVRVLASVGERAAVHILPPLLLQPCATAPYLSGASSL